MWEHKTLFRQPTYSNACTVRRHHDDRVIPEHEGPEQVLWSLVALAPAKHGDLPHADYLGKHQTESAAVNSTPAQLFSSQQRPRTMATADTKMQDN